VSCIDRRVRLGLASLTLMAGCSSPPPPSPSAAATPATPARAAPAAPVAATVASAHLPAPQPVRSWGELRLQAAHRIVAANPDGSYMGTPPDQLLAIPVLEIELNADGSIRNIEYLRAPREAKDTMKLAADAVRRAAPFGDVSRLPKPWRFTETFLFDDDRKFKPRSLD
jgi:hypothetical protein